MDVFPEKETRLFIPGPVGKLQAIVTPGKSTSGKTGLTSDNGAKQVAIVCHPHSLMGGTMNNKVVHTLARMHRDAGNAVVRFNFRGVEQSDGEYDAGIGETADLLAVMSWIRAYFPEAELRIAGFSFGSFVASRAVGPALEAGFKIRDLLLVAPAVENYEFDKLIEFAVPVAMIYGDQDEVVDSGRIRDWFDLVITAKCCACLGGAGHFFHGRLPELKSQAEQLCNLEPL